MRYTVVNASDIADVFKIMKERAEFPAQKEMLYQTASFLSEHLIRMSRDFSQREFMERAGMSEEMARPQFPRNPAPEGPTPRIRVHRPPQPAGEFVAEMPNSPHVPYYAPPPPPAPPPPGAVNPPRPVNPAPEGPTRGMLVQTGMAALTEELNQRLIDRMYRAMQAVEPPLQSQIDYYADAARQMSTTGYGHVDAPPPVSPPSRPAPDNPPTAQAAEGQLTPGRVWWDEAAVLFNQHQMRVGRRRNRTPED